MRIYYVLDHANDYIRLCGKVDNSSYLIPISADAYTSIPKDFPKDLVVSLSSLISESELSSIVNNRVDFLWKELSTYKNCPYYKVKQLLDSIIEKEIIVDRLSVLVGKKYFFGCKNQWVSVDGDNSESCRFAAIFMRGRENFIEVPIKSEAINRVRILLLLRAIKHSFGLVIKKSYWKRCSDKEILLGSVGYGALSDFSGKNARYLNHGAIILMLFWSLRWVDLWRVITHNFPVKINPKKSEEKYFYIQLCREVVERSEALQKIADKLMQKLWKKPLFFFTVNYGRLLDLAIIRSLRKLNVPIISMQHALVGHDRWTASQYLDLWESDIKLVSNKYVAESLRKFEENRNNTTYLPVSIPMFRRGSELVSWNGFSVAYIFTGFTRANTMYDNRRINDSIYFERIRDDLPTLTSKFSVSIMTHPYDKRQYNDRIGKFLSRLNNISCINSLADAKKNNSIVFLDSPSTILADAVLSGLPIVIVNRTSTLSDDFILAASKYGILFRSTDEFISRQDEVDLKIFNENQESFASWFKETYCFPSENVHICEAITRHLSVNSLDISSQEG